MRTAERESIAAELMRAWREGVVVTMPSQRFTDFAQSDAVAVAERLRELRVTGGDASAGYKVGFTNAGVRAQFGTPGLLAATVYRATVSDARSVRAAAYLGPRIEPEIVLGIAAGEVAWAAFGFEIVQSHARDWTFGFSDAIADFGLHAALIVGERRALDTHAAAALSNVRVRLLREGDVMERGRGADVDGGPLGSLEWLREELAGYGRELLDGELVSTGSLTRVPPIRAGERWNVVADGDELPALTLDVV